MSRYASALKALLGALIAFVGSLVTAVSDSHLTAAEWLTAVLAGLVALGVVYRVPNRD